MMKTIKPSAAFKTLAAKAKDADWDSFLESVAGLLDDLDVERDRFRQAWEEEYGKPYPRSYADWSRFAMMTTDNADKSLSLDFTPADMLPIIEGFLLRHKMMGNGKPRKRKNGNGKGPGRPSEDEEAERTLKLWESGRFATKKDLAQSLDVEAPTVTKRIQRAKRNRLK